MFAGFFIFQKEHLVEIPKLWDEVTAMTATALLLVNKIVALFILFRWKGLLLNRFLLRQRGGQAKSSLYTFMLFRWRVIKS